MSGIYDLLENIKKRPKMYIGSLSITKLHMLLMGYSIGKMEENLNKIGEESKLQEFQQWIQDKYNVLASKSWATIILENSTNEEDAFNKFFELFNEFRNQVSKI
jgi:recombinational DNA repair protein (RecF pathway)